MKKKERIVLGIDPGFGRMGFGVLRADGRSVSVLDYGVITTPSRLPQASRYVALAEDLEVLLNEYHPDVLSMEKMFFTKSRTTALQIAEVRGIVLFLAARCGAQVCEFTPSQVKLACAGNGRADKRGMQHMIRILLRLPRAPKPDDAADALALAFVGASSRMDIH